MLREADAGGLKVVTAGWGWDALIASLSFRIRSSPAYLAGLSRRDPLIAGLSQHSAVSRGMRLSSVSNKAWMILVVGGLAFLTVTMTGMVVRMTHWCKTKSNIHRYLKI
eukprot:gene26584-biopygen4104